MDVSYTVSLFMYYLQFRPAHMVLWSPRLPFKLGDPGSILGRTSTQGLKITEEKELPLH